jgi:hypothetical protein
VKVIQLDDGSPVPFEIVCAAGSTSSGALALGRARWFPDGSAIGYICEGEDGGLGVFAQDFVPGRDTRATRRKIGESPQDRIPESFGFSPDGKSLVVSQLELRQAIVLAEKLPGVDRPGRKAN